jgi:PP-loop superfamily ATP-utilizing enzyme
MTDTDGVHRILADVLDLKRQLAEKDARIDRWKKEVIKWQDTDTENQEKIEKAAELRKKLEKRIHNQRVALRDNWMIIEDRAQHMPTLLKSMWQDIAKKYRRKIQEQNVEIADLKIGFIDVEEAFEMTETKPGMPSFTEEQIRRWIREEEDATRAWIADEMSKFFNLINKSRLEQQIKVIEACGFKVIPEEAPAPASGDDDQGPDDSKMPDSTSPQDTYINVYEAKGEP